MRIIIERDAEAVARCAAARVAKRVQRRPHCVLGLPTGNTVVGFYRELVRWHRSEGLDFSGVATFNLDEYIGLGREHPQSFASYMRRHLFDQVNFDPDHIHHPNGLAVDLEAECSRYEQEIRSAGGIDLQIMGIGSSGHIAFNEPGSSLASLTRVKTLTRETRVRNAQHFGAADEVPRLAITMGIGTIRAARSCELLATGSEKTVAVRDTVEGPVTAQVPSSALQLHPDVVLVLDEDAARSLSRIEYYREMEAAQRELEASGRA
ncbi:MAG: glucosamine-6-phosphate deaminase [Myxococcota bacterium]